MTDSTVQNVRGYELRDKLGAGGFGEVYRAFQAIVGREVAMKIILPQYANRSDFILRFETEAQLVARLEHIHIVPLYDYWRDPKGAYLVMRLLTGGSLRSVLKRGPLSLDYTAQVLDQITSALAAAHRRGVVHRDLKPDNILLDEEGNAYLADFGIAKDVGKLEAGEHENIVGSPAYLSPEQVMGDAVSPRTDIYCLGIMLYELLTGTVPFAGASTSELLTKHLNEPIPPLKAEQIALPGKLDEVIQKATAKEPSERYQDAPSVAVAFRKALTAMPGTEQTETQTPVDAAPQSVPHTSAPRAYLPAEDTESPTLVTIDELPQLRPTSDGTAQDTQPTLVEMPTFDVVNPYKGLRAFQQADAADFFGRASLIEQLIARMGQDDELARFLAVVGPSGSGKSSVVRAGLLPTLRGGALPGSGRWFLVEMIPGARPLEQLEEALLRVATTASDNLLAQLAEDEYGLLHAVHKMLPPDTEMVLVIDQFEEVFTLLEDESKRTHFLNSVMNAVIDPASRIRVIVTLRADFYDRPLLYPDFGNVIRKRTEVVLPLNKSELEQAITGPAQRVGVKMESGLVNAMLDDLGDQPGALPLLQYALTELFERRKGLTLTLAAYRESGGVLGALARRAEELFNDLDADQQEAVRQVFLRLVTVGEGTEDTRRRVHLTELTSVSGSRQATDAVIELFSRYRLLTLDRDPATRAPTVEIAHEALIRTWERLRGWLAESREDLQLQRRLTSMASDWLAAARDNSFLATGTRLDQFEGWAAGTTIALNKDERAFLDASIADHNARLAREEARKAHEAALERRSRDRLRALVVILLVATVGALGLTGLAVNQQQLAVANAATATNAQGLAVYNANTAVANAQTATVAQGQAFNNAVTATNAQGLAVHNAQTAVANAQTATVAQGQAVANAATAQSNFIHSESQRLAAEALNLAQAVDGNTELAGLLAVHAINLDYSPQADSMLVRATTLNYARQIYRHGGQINVVAFSPDGKTVLTGANDGVVNLWNTQSGKLLRKIQPPSIALGLSVVWTGAFSPDGRYIMISSAGSQLRIWDAQTGRQVQQLHGEVESNSAVFSPDGRYLLTEGKDNTALLWDVEGGLVLRRFVGHTAQVGPVAFSPDGKTVMTGADDKTARLWDVATGQQIAMFSDPNSRISSLAFTPDGQQVLVSASSMVLYDLQTGQKVRDFPGSSPSVAFSPDGKTLLASGGIKSAQLFDVATGQEIRRLTGHTDVITAVAYSANGRLALTGSWDGTARLWDMTSVGAPSRLMSGDMGKVTELTYSPDGRYILAASSGNDHKVWLWDAQTGSLVRTLDGHTDALLCAEFSPDGKTALTCSADKTIRLWDVATGKQIREFDGHTDEIRGAVFSPDGTRIASGGLDQTARLWDTATSKQILQFKNDGGEILDVAYSPDGKSVLVGNIDDYARLFDVTTGAEIKRFAAGTGSEGFVVGVGFSPDGKSIVTGSFDKSVRIFDVASGKQTQQFNGHTEAVIRVAFSPDGKSVVSASQDTTARLWDATSGKETRRFTGHTDQLYGVAFSPDGKRVITGAKDRTIRVWDVDYHDSIRFVCSQLLRDLTPAERAQYGITDTNPTCASGASAATPQPVPAWTPVPLAAGVQELHIAGSPRLFSGAKQGLWALAFSPDGKYLLAGGSDKTLILWDAQSGKVIKTMSGHTSDIYAAAFSPDGKYVASGAYDGTVRLWDVQSGQQIRVFTGINSGVDSVAFSPDGHSIAAGAENRAAYLWDVQSGQQIHVFSGHDKTVHSVAFSPDGQYIVTGSYDKTARLWNAQTGEQIRLFTGHADEVLAVAFSPDGKYIATGGGAASSPTGGGDTTIRLWDVQSGQVIRQFAGHTKQVNSLTFSKDGAYLISAASDSTVRLWDVQNGAEIRRLSSSTSTADFMLNVAVSPDGQTIAATAFGETSVQAWDIGPIDLTNRLLPFTPTPEQ